MKTMGPLAGSLVTLNANAHISSELGGTGTSGADLLSFHLLRSCSDKDDEMIVRDGGLSSGLGRNAIIASSKDSTPFPLRIYNAHTYEYE
jgi:hypothetical protein